MKKLKNLSAWRHEWFHQQFVITGATHVGWKVYLFGENSKKVRMFKDAFLVKSIDAFRPIQSTRDIKSAQYFNKLFGFIVQRVLQRKYKSIFFRLIPASQAAFIPDLKPATINSPFGIISFEN
jgi:hypothetical protein